MELKFNVRELSPEEREYISAFIAGYPVAERPAPRQQTLEIEVRADSSKLAGDINAAIDQINGLGSAIVAAGEVQILANEQDADLEESLTQQAHSTASAAAEAFGGAAPELDTQGLPWDGRIHSGSKSKNKDGSWRLKRDLPDATRDAVLTELRQLMAAPAPVTTVVNTGCATAEQVAAAATAEINRGAVVVNGAEIGAAAAIVQAGPAFVPPPPAAATTAAPVPPPPAAANGAVTLADLLTFAGHQMVAQKITSEAVTAICVARGVPNLGIVSARPDLIGPIYDDIKAACAA